jgi:tetratricopeptide (TPR) repeat protein
MKKHISYFEKLSSREILDLPAGALGDYELLDVLAHFDDIDDEERYNATVELILRSPECSELVDYSQLYFDLVSTYQAQGDRQTALGWAYAWLVYTEQHEDGASRTHCVNSLALIYLELGDPDSGLALLARRLRADPGDLHTCVTLATKLLDFDLYDLARRAAERGLALHDHPDYAEYQKTLESLHKNASERADSEVVQGVQASAQVLSALKQALAENGVPTEPAQEPYLPPITEMLEIGEQADPALFADIIAQGRLLAPDLIRLAFDATMANEPARDHAITLLRALAPRMEPEFTLLGTWLARAEGNWQDELLSTLMGKIGGFTSGELESIAADRQVNEMIRIAALDALTERAKKLPEQRARVTQFFAQLLERPEAGEASEEELNGILIMEILDLGARELYPQIKAAFDEDRVAPMTTSLAEVHEEWGLEPIQEPAIPNDVLDLQLICTACGRTRLHTTRYVLIDQGTIDKADQDHPTRFDPCILDHEVVCPKCGARDRYKLNYLSTLQIFIPRDGEAIMALVRDEMPDSPPKLHPSAYFFRSAAFGREMHPLEALEEYRWHTAKSPGDAELRLGYAKVLRTLFRHDQALEQARFTLELAPDDPEALIFHAMAEHDLGDREAARRSYRRILELEVEGNEFPDYSQAAIQGLKALERGGTSEWKVPAYNTYGETPPVPGAAPRKARRQPKAERKRGRKHRHSGKMKS